MSATIEEARSLTGFTRDVISGEEMVSLHSRVKKEIEADLGGSVDFSTAASDTAVFWMLCLFMKVHVGDIGSAAYSVGELEEAPLDDEANMWLNRYRQRRDELTRSQRDGYGHTSAGRDGRQYGTDS